MDRPQAAVDQDARRRIPLSEPCIGPRERGYVLDALDRNWISQGKYVQACEDMLRQITGRKYAIMTSSGTAALNVALAALAVWEGAGVQVPSLTFAAVHNSVVNARAENVFVDADAETWQATAYDRYKGKFMIVAPCYGFIGPMAEIERFAAETRITMIEDASESFGGFEHARPCGSFGAVSTVSFYANKICTAGEGGACLTDDEALAERIRLLANHGIANKDYSPSEAGWNFRMTDLQAAVLLGQLERLTELLGKRHQVWRWYNERIPSTWRPHVLASQEPAPWLYAVAFKNRGLMKFKEAGIEVRSFFRPGHQNSLYTLSVFDKCPVATGLHNEGWVLPTHPNMTEDDVDRICRILLEAA